jgi:DNA polymerase II large subunit
MNCKECQKSLIRGQTLRCEACGNHFHIDCTTLPLSGYCDDCIGEYQLLSDAVQKYAQEGKEVPIFKETE